MLITLDNLRQTLQAVKNKLDGITSRVSTVESSVNTMSSNMVNSVNGQTGAVTGIATASDVDALEARVDNIVAPSGDPSLTEVSDARVGADSTVYSTLKGRIDGEVSELNERLGDAEGNINRNNYYRLYDGNQALKTYATRTLARTDVPSVNRKVGLVLVYKLSNSFEEEKIIIERFDGSINHWLSDQLWYDFSSPKLYWGKVPKPEIHIENYVKQVIVDAPVIVGIRFVYSLTNNNFSILASVHNSDETTIKFVGRLDNINIPTTPGITEYTLTKYDETDPIITVIVDTYRLSTENFTTGFISYDSASLAGAYGSCVHSTIKKEAYDIVYDAVRKGKTGTVKVGQIQMNGNSVVDVPVSYTDFVTKPVEEAYTPMLRNELFPYIRKATQKRVTIDNVVMYMCSFSPKRVYFSTTPTSQIVYDDYDDLAYSFMGYADKDNLDTVIKINLPSDMPNARYPGVHIGRRKYIMELSNGDALIEVENGLEISGDVECRNNLYLISNFTSYVPQNGEITIPASACTRVLQFVGNSTIAKFMSSVEYAPGKIMLTPYGSKKSARVYISEDYGNTWELIFCGDVDNAENIPVKAEYLQTETAAGAWPTPYAVIPKNAVDWSKTGNNNIHVHGCAYDHYYDRIWIVTGDGGGVLNSVTGIWYTDDMGLNWHKVELGGENEPFYHFGTQFIDVIPMDNVVIFGNDGQGDGFYRWVRNGKKANVVIEPVYQFTGENTSLSVVGQTWYKAKNGFVFQTFSPNHDIARGDYKIRGGVVATYNGFSFSKIYTDEFTDVSGDGQLAYDTHEIGWGCRITEDANGNILTTARQGGYLLMEY